MHSEGIHKRLIYVLSRGKGDREGSGKEGGTGLTGHE